MVRSAWCLQMTPLWLLPQILLVGWTKMFAHVCPTHEGSAAIWSGGTRLPQGGHMHLGFGRRKNKDEHAKTKEAHHPFYRDPTVCSTK